MANEINDCMISWDNIIDVLIVRSKVFDSSEVEKNIFFFFSQRKSLKKIRFLLTKNEHVATLFPSNRASRPFVISLCSTSNRLPSPFLLLAPCFLAPNLSISLFQIHFRVQFLLFFIPRPNRCDNYLLYLFNQLNSTILQSETLGLDVSSKIQRLRAFSSPLLGGNHGKLVCLYRYPTLEMSFLMDDKCSMWDGAFLFSY